MNGRWFKLECRAITHAKVIELNDNEFRFWIECIAYSSDQGTNGLITASWVQRVAHRSLDVAEKLVEVGLFDRQDSDYVIHDYLDYQPDSSIREKQRMGGTKGAAIRWGKQAKSEEAIGNPLGRPIGRPNSTIRNDTNTKEKKEKEKAKEKEIVAAPLAIIETPARDEAVILRELASDVLLARNDFLPPDLQGDKGKRWESAVRNLMVKDGVPFEKIEFVARNVWDQEFHANRFLKHTSVRSTFTAVLNAVNAKHRPKDFAIKNVGDAKASALLAAAERMKQKEDEVWT